MSHLARCKISVTSAISRCSSESKVYFACWEKRRRTHVPYTVCMYNMAIPNSLRCHIIHIPIPSHLCTRILLINPLSQPFVSFTPVHQLLLYILCISRATLYSQLSPHSHLYPAAFKPIFCPPMPTFTYFPILKPPSPPSPPGPRLPPRGI